MDAIFSLEYIIFVFIFWLLIYFITSFFVNLCFKYFDMDVRDKRRKTIGMYIGYVQGKSFSVNPEYSTERHEVYRIVDDTAPTNIKIKVKGYRKAFWVERKNCIIYDHFLIELGEAEVQSIIKRIDEEMWKKKKENR